MKNACVSEYHGIKHQLCFQWNNWHQLMWGLLLHGVVTLQVLSVSTCWVCLWVCIALFWAYLLKNKCFQKISSNNMCCTDVSWGNQHQKQEKPEDDLLVQNRKQLEVPLGENRNLIHYQWHYFSGTERGFCSPSNGQTHLPFMQMMPSVHG